MTWTRLVTGPIVNRVEAKSRNECIRIDILSQNTSHGL